MTRTAVAAGFITVVALSVNLGLDSNLSLVEEPGCGSDPADFRQVLPRLPLLRFATPGVSTVLHRHLLYAW